MGNLTVISLSYLDSEYSLLKDTVDIYNNTLKIPC